MPRGVEDGEDSKPAKQPFEGPSLPKEWSISLGLRQQLQHDAKQGDLLHLPASVKPSLIMQCVYYIYNEGYPSYVVFSLRNEQKRGAFLEEERRLEPTGQLPQQFRIIKLNRQ